MPNPSPNPRPELDAWIHRLTIEQMPVMCRTALDIASIAAKEETPTSALVSAILKDPSLTARVLTLANSVVYNPRGQSLSTVSRALVVLGFNTVRSICLSVTLVDSLLSGMRRRQLLAELARSFHAAVLARAMAVERSDDSPEEIFIASLLFRLGELAFWCFGGTQRDELELAFKNEDDHTRAEQRILGFRFSELSLGLAQKWKLGSLLETALRDGGSVHARARIVHLSHEYVSEVEHADDPTAVKLLIQEISRFLSISQSSVNKLLESCVREAADAAAMCGAPSAAARITKMVRKEDATPESQPPANVDAKPPDSQFPQFDPLLQLTILRELSSLLSTKTDLNQFIETVLEGMYRSIGMDRAIFSLVNADRSRLTAKFALGHHVAALRDVFDIPLVEPEPHIFASALEKKIILWAKVGNSSGSSAFIQRRIRDVVGDGPFFIAPAVLLGRSIGLFYVDRRSTGRELDDESFESFRHFSQQANLGLDYLGRQHGGK